MVRTLGELVAVMTLGPPASPETVISRSTYTAPQSGTRKIFVRRNTSAWSCCRTTPLNGSGSGRAGMMF
jgi:hypothetical protein